MPELPDVALYVEALQERVAGHKLTGVLIRGPFLLRSVEPPVESLVGKTVRRVSRLGKRIVISFEEDISLVFHLMIAGRLHWKAAGAKAAKMGGRNFLALFAFDSGNLTLTEAGTQHRASLHVVKGPLDGLDPGGLEILETALAAFAAALRRENHTLKRALTDPHIFSGVGNAYSDEILHRAGLSPVALTQKLRDEDVAALFRASQKVLLEWSSRLRAQAKGAFPENVTAFHPEMAAHGRYGQPCPACGTKIQRIRYSSNETNYCPRCPDRRKLLADRALSRLLREDWPKTADELEARKKMRERLERQPNHQIDLVALR